MDTAKSLDEARQQVIGKMCNELYELSAFNSEARQLGLLNSLSREMDSLWDLFEVEDG